MKKQSKKIIALLAVFAMSFLVLSSKGEGAKLMRLVNQWYLEIL